MHVEQPNLGWISVEKAFDEFVSKTGGRLVRDLIGNRNPAKNADYLFPESTVIAELKSLQKDTFDTNYRRRLNRLIESWMHRHLIVVYGRSSLRLRDLPSQCQREWIQLLEAPIRRVVADANKQIKSTKRVLGLPKAKGFLLLASDGNYSLEPEDVAILLNGVLKKRKQTGDFMYSSIHGFAYFSVNMVIRSPAVSGDAVFWVGGARQKGETDVDRFEGYLHDGWFEYRAQLTGEILPKAELI